MFFRHFTIGSLSALGPAAGYSVSLEVMGSPRRFGKEGYAGFIPCGGSSISVKKLDSSRIYL